MCIKSELYHEIVPICTPNSVVALELAFKNIANFNLAKACLEGDLQGVKRDIQYIE